MKFDEICAQHQMDFGSQKTITGKNKSRMIPYLLQLVMAQDRSDIIFFLRFFVCFAVYKLSQLKKSKVTWFEPRQMDKGDAPSSS